MTVPLEYELASRKFVEFLVDARDASGLWSTHAAYTMTQGVFQVFRRRLCLAQAIQFAAVLPVGLRALFTADWDVEEEIRCFGDCEAMRREVRELRAAHNFSPDSAIRSVADSLRKHVDEKAFDELLDQLPRGVKHFWQCC
ncbi:DUF2267 domain-containing protein [Marinobacter sp. CHS3-4]|uniref:DUF2267 domain-containing protein n=1 Tax=Marinobacter sp. CHS3-4 TaxID=3045174 RepID=UPI0024B482D3|nr:DUF2267 domain-containing protein [Marinobacter sp. CHS3-4]MDI9245367.1 DUF2267 domain-containing protein [Marinobacter sp. CHS3-4]